jgi:hypothetical protein
VKDPDVLNGIKYIFCGVVFLGVVAYQLYEGTIYIKGVSYMPIARGWPILIVPFALGAFLIYYGVKLVRESW